MAPLWWVQADVTMKRWRGITEQHGEDQISHQPSGVSGRKLSLQLCCKAFLNRGTQHWENFLHLWRFMLSHTDAERFFGVGGLQQRAADVNRLDIRKHFLLTGHAQASEIRKFQHITGLCLFTLKPWAQGCLSLSFSACKGNSKAIHFCSLSLRNRSLLKPLEASDDSKTIWYTGQRVRKLALMAFTSSGASLTIFSSIFIKSIKCTSTGSIPGI